jgi:ABC-type multidrug transport system fused ATPase/permease subunit
VSQDIAIFNSTIGENIAYGAPKKVSQAEIEEAARLAHIDEFIQNLPRGYKTRVGEKGLRLSGGQKQRIAIARAILRNPKILILDEPTSALDIVSEKYITESLEELMKNRTTIIIAHRLSTVRKTDKIFVFNDGEVVEDGSYDELISQKGEFNKMVELHKGLK